MIFSKYRVEGWYSTKHIYLFIYFPPDHITRSQMSVDESVGESSYQLLLQVLFYLILVATNVRAADDPTVIIQLVSYCYLFFFIVFHFLQKADTTITFDGLRFSSTMSVLSLSMGQFKVSLQPHET